MIRSAIQAGVLLFMFRQASVYAGVSRSAISVVALVILLLTLFSCLAGISVAVSPDRLYATGFNGSYLPPGHGDNAGYAGYLGKASLFVIDPADGVPMYSVPMNEAGYFLAISPSGSRLYSTNGYSRNITVVDLVSHMVTAKVPLNSPPCGIALSPDGDTIYVAMPGEKAVVALDASTYAARAFIPLGVSPYSLAISSDGSRLYAASSLNGTVSTISIPGNVIISTVPVGADLADAVIVRDNIVYVAGSGNNAVYALDVARNLEKTAISGIVAPSCLAFDVSKNSLIVTSHQDRNITRIDVSGDNIAVRRAFWSSSYGRPAISSDGSTVYVPDDAGKIRVINASSLVETGVISTAYPVTAIALMPPQAALPAQSPTSAPPAASTPVPPAPSPVPTGVSQPAYSPGYTGVTPVPLDIPLPIPPKISIPPRPSPEYISYGDWKVPFPVRAITTNDILIVLLCCAAILVVLSGIAYMMMFRQKKE